jgi:hypothetical protein
MDAETFRLRVISTFQNLKYIFAKDAASGEPLKRPSAGQKAIATAAYSITWGLAGALAVEYPEFSDSQVKAEIEKLENICDLVGVRLDTGGVLLALFIPSDNLAADALIGKSVIIHDKLKRFKSFCTRLGWMKRGAIADVFFVFEKLDKTFQFRHSIQSSCKHGEFFGKRYTLPWCIDISAKSVLGYGGWPPPGYMTGLKLRDLETNLFG